MFARVTSSLCHSHSSVVFLLRRHFSSLYSSVTSVFTCFIQKVTIFYCFAAQTVPGVARSPQELGAPRDSSCALLTCPAAFWFQEMLSPPRTFSALEAAISPGSPGPRYWRMAFGDLGQGLGVLAASRPSADRVGRVHTRGRMWLSVHTDTRSLTPPSWRRRLPPLCVSLAPLAGRLSSVCRLTCSFPEFPESSFRDTSPGHCAEGLLTRILVHPVSSACGPRVQILSSAATDVVSPSPAVALFTHLKYSWVHFF